MKTWNVLLCLFLCALTAGAQTSRSYSTNFPLTENPISEGGNWVNGTTGINWSDVSTTPGLAIGHQGSVPYSDATALLQTGTWNPDQVAQATVYSVIPTQSCGQEVELRLRSFIAADSITGYEISYSTAFGGTLIVRWNGPLGNFTILKIFSGVTVHNGDVVKATMVGTTISAYKNGVLLGKVSDSSYKNGYPGIGFNLNLQNPGCTTDTSLTYGFTSFSAVSSSSSTHGRKKPKP